MLGGTAIAMVERPRQTGEKDQIHDSKGVNSSVLNAPDQLFPVVRFALNTSSGITRRRCDTTNLITYSPLKE